MTRTLTVAAIVSTLLSVASPAHAQWLNYPTPGLPRTADGKPNLSAPAPRTADGKPDFSGVWGFDGGPSMFYLPAGLKPNEIKPFAMDLLKERGETFGRGDQQVRCLPEGPRFNHFPALPRKIVQTPTLIVVLSEDLTFRQIFLDGRPLPDSPSPSFMGYSVGRWEGDTLVVESIGFKDSTWLDFAGSPHSEAIRLTERYRRVDFGHLEIEESFRDPDIYSRPLTARVEATLRQPLRDLTFDGTVEAEPFALATFDAELPQATVGGRFAARGELEAFRGEADLAAETADYGPLAADLGFERRGERWRIERLVLTSRAASAARIEADGRKAELTEALNISAQARQEAKDMASSLSRAGEASRQIDADLEAARAANELAKGTQTEQELEQLREKAAAKAARARLEGGGRLGGRHLRCRGMRIRGRGGQHVLACDPSLRAGALDRGQVHPELAGQFTDQGQGLHPAPGATNGGPIRGGQHLGLLAERSHYRSSGVTAGDRGHGWIRLPGLAGPTLCFRLLPDHHQDRADLDGLTLGSAMTQHDTGIRGRDLHHRLVGLHLHHRLIGLDPATLGNQPADDLGLGEALADVW